MRKEVAHNLMRLIAEGTEDEETDRELRMDAVSSYLALLDKPNLPDILIKIMCWVGGCGLQDHVMGGCGLDHVLDGCGLQDRNWCGMNHIPGVYCIVITSLHHAITSSLHHAIRCWGSMLM